MRTTLFALALVLSATPAFAEVVTVRITGHVEWVGDDANVLGGQVTIGQAVTGRYRYDTAVPDEYPNMPDDGSFPQSAQQGLMSATVGGLTFETDSTSSNWMFSAFVHRSYFMEYQGYMALSSMNGRPLPNGASVAMTLWIASNMGGGVPASDRLLAGAPDPAVFQDRRLQIGGQPIGGGAWYGVIVRIDSAELVPTLTVSPTDGSFVRPQHVDPAVIGVSGAIVAVRGTVNGDPLPPSYIDQCQPVRGNAQGRPAVTCPDIVPLLPAGRNRVEWSVDFGDGSTGSRTVDWEVIE